MQSWDGAQVSLEFAEGHLDRVKVRGILRQIAKGCAGGFDRFADSGDFVGSKIIDHHDTVSLQCWHEAMSDIGQEHFSGHRSVEHHWCNHLVVTKRGDESDSLPGPLRLTAVLTAIPKSSATSCRDAPDATASITCLRKSAE